MSETLVSGPWYVGAMNDALFVINQKPSPSGTDAPLDTPHPGLKVVAKVETGDGRDVDNAIAHRIAALPKIYAALLLCKQQLQCLNLPCGTQNEALVAATAALAEAVGEAA